MLRTLRALALSTHPGPTVAVTFVTVLLSIGAGLEPWRVALVGAAMLFDQVSVGLSNDAIDAHRDVAVGRTDKPIARGEISRRFVFVASIVAAALAVLLTVPLGPLAVVVHVIALASAWSYNLGLKSTAISVLPYVVTFGLLASVATLSGMQPRFAPWWATAAGAALGIAAHIGNVLPDLEDDAATGVRGLPHRMGRTVAGVTTAVSLAAASTFVVLGPGSAPDALHLIALALALVIATVTVILVVTNRRTRLLFRLVIAAALIDVVALATSGLR
jgi:4-hydroxybenzoate polyprenyltransferase